LDLVDHDKELIVRAELPGVEKDDVKVTISGDRLMIEAEREFEEEDEKEDFYRLELGYGKLMRTVVLPVEVDADKIHAELKEGILNVTLPKIRAGSEGKVYSNNKQILILRIWSYIIIHHPLRTGTDSAFGS
jgi:HSP20 family protein